MEFTFTEEQEKLRKEIREFFMSELPEDYDKGGLGGGFGAVSEEAQSFWTGLKKKGIGKGYYVSGWPKEYGGSGFTDIEQGILTEEQGYLGVRWPDMLGLHLVGPSLILIGTEEQKKKFIPPIARGETMCFEVFTEPDAGSDEANQQTRAVEDGDDYILNGQKMFISGSYKPNWMFTLARTEETVPKHRGITLFLIPADTPGITFRPLMTMGGGMQNEVFFDDVRVSKDYILGQKNRGFYHAMQVFEFERSMTGGAAGSKRQLEEFIQFCRETKRNGKPLIEDHQVRQILATIAVEIEIQRLAGWYTTWRFAERERLGPAAYNVSNYYAKQWTAKHNKAMLDILGLYGQLRNGSKWAAFAGRLENGWRTARSLHAGGTIEVMKIVLAQRGLGLPRIPAQLMAEIGKATKQT